MNVLANELYKHYEQIQPMDFYREIFPEGELDEYEAMTKGKYTAIALEITNQHRENGKQIIKRYSVTDDLDVIDGLLYSNNFCVMAPISYAGKNRNSSNARIMYALVVELDNLIVRKGKQEGLENLIDQFSEKVHWIPQPTFLVASGTGIHLYYQFEKGVPLFPNVVKSLERYKRVLTEMIWNKNVTTSIGEEIQQESIFQGFRMVGTITKLGDRVEAFRVGEPVTIEYMNSFLVSKDAGAVIDVVYKSNLTKAQAKEKYPDWFERRIEKGEEKGIWICKRDLYEWWKRRIKEEAVVGHRYYCLMALSIYAIKCDIPEDELEQDCFELMEVFEERTNNKNNHFTEKDVLDALQSFYDKGLITYPINSIQNRSGLKIEKNKRNYRKQELHLKLARATKAILKEAGELETDGRPSKEQLVKDYLAANPEERNVSKIAQALNVSRSTVYKYYNLRTTLY